MIQRSASTAAHWQPAPPRLHPIGVNMNLSQKIPKLLALGILSTGFVAANAGFAASSGNVAGTQTQMVVTVIPKQGNTAPATLGADDLSVQIGKTQARVLGTEPLTGDMANMQLFILIDDSVRASTLGLQIGDLKSFISSLPPATQVAIGYMKNGTASVVQPFTDDHAKAAATVRLPEAIPGGNGSPYFALSDLAKHWPSKQPVARRTVLMLTDGVDRYFDNSMVQDPYVDSAIQDALKHNLSVYSIYLRDTGLYDRRATPTLFAQSRLDQVSNQTGGIAYFEDFTNPVSIKPFLEDLQNRLNHQYQVSLETFAAKGMQRLDVHSELGGIKIQAPTRIYVP